MHIGLDIDDTLISHWGFADEWCEVICEQIGATPGTWDRRQTHYSARYGILERYEREFDSVLWELYQKAQKIPQESVDFVNELYRLQHRVSIITHRRVSSAKFTQEQLAPLLSIHPEIKVYHATGDKSEWMLALGIQLMIDDHPKVWADVIRYPQLSMISPDLECNQNSVAPKYKDWNEALQMIAELESNYSKFN